MVVVVVAGKCPITRYDEVCSVYIRFWPTQSMYAIRSLTSVRAYLCDQCT